MFDLKKFREMNVKRCEEVFGHKLDSWSIAEWTNAMCGEAGEAANIAKKLIRLRDGIIGNKPDDKNQLVLEMRLVREIADVIIYADLILAKYNVDMERILEVKFNDKSIELGASEYQI